MTAVSVTTAADIGSRLRHARQQRNLSLHDAGRLTKLPIHVLEAIERNDFERLPHGIYRKAYVRTLAGEVGLDPDVVAADYAAEYEPALEAPPDDAATGNAEWLRELTPSPRPSLLTLLLLVLLAAAWMWSAGAA